METDKKDKIIIALIIGIIIVISRILFQVKIMMSLYLKNKVYQLK